MYMGSWGKICLPGGGPWDAGEMGKASAEWRWPEVCDPTEKGSRQRSLPANKKEGAAASSFEICNINFGFSYP